MEVQDARHYELAIAYSATTRVDVIEEIVVIGAKNKPVRRFHRNADIAPVFNKPSRFELQLLPVHDPDDPYRRTVKFQLHDPIRNVGIVEVFRIRFGGKRT